MKIVNEPFGVTVQGQPVERYTLTDGNCSASVLTLGGILQSWTVPDRNGAPTDIVLGFDSVGAYEAQDCYIGALLGRCANRIADGRITVGQQTYTLACNDNGINHLHGGMVGFDRRIWKATVLPDGLQLQYESPDGEEGYPGRLSVTAIYRLTQDTLSIEFFAQSDKDTVCNLSSHSYFNLGGHASGSVGSQMIQVDADRYTPLASNNAPTGEVASVEGTPFDLRQPVRFDAGWDSDFTQIALAGGYDHNYIPAGDGLRPFAQASCPQTGITLTVTSDMPGVQLYTGNFLRDDLPEGKQHAKYDRRHGFCLETQFWPNAFACPDFPQPIVHVGETYHHITNDRYSVCP